MNDQSRRALMRRCGGALALSLSPGLAGVRADDPSPSRPRIKVGQIGVGHAHASKLAVFRRSADYEVVGVVEPDPELRARAEAQDTYRGVHWLTQEQLLNEPGLQAVLVETRVRDLLDTAEACVKAGKHVHVDKPAGESLPQFRRILDEAARRKLLVQMGYMFRYNPAVVLLRDLLKRGWLGEVFEVHAVMSKVVEPAARRGLAEYRGGIMFELGCHVIDLVVGVLGKPAKVAPFARHAARVDDGLQDNMLAVFEYPKALATVKASALEVDGFQRRHLVVCGTEGTFHIQPLDDPAAKLALTTARGAYQPGYQQITFPKYTRYVDDAADMARVIRGEKAADFSYEHDLAVQRALLEASELPCDR
ncbi:MAG: Gfo/Idh/MocA family oxidoreductase [Isosphaeraceae bacterium]|nr:Gfo/Idh/MocA family oxidoreductase [Isosphaeraceae bacterium]